MSRRGLTRFVNEAAASVAAEPARGGMTGDEQLTRELLADGTPLADCLDGLLAHVDAMWWVTDAGLGVTSLLGTDYAGRDRPELEGLHLAEVLVANPGDDENAVAEALRLVLVEQSAPFEYAWGDTHLIGQIEPMRNDAGDLTGTVGVVLDVSESRSAETELERQAELMQAMAAIANCLLVTPDLGEALQQMLATIGPVMRVDRAFLFVRHEHPSTGEPAVSATQQWQRPGFQSRTRNEFENLTLDDRELGTLRRKLEQGKIVVSTPADFPLEPGNRYGLEADMQMLQVPVFVEDELWGVVVLELTGDERRWTDAERSLLHAVASDIGAAVGRHRATERARHQAYHDPLTDLPNRQLLHDRAEQAIRLARRNDETLALVLVDLDRFKLVNDSLGHGVGDEVLLRVRDRLDDLIGEGDTLARIGGDEFAILLPELDRVEDAVRIAQDIIAANSFALAAGGRELYTSVSIGIAFFPFDGVSPEELLRNAGSAQMRAKNQGGGAYQLYSSEMNAAAFERLVLENSLRGAVSNEELTVYYQPLVSLTSGSVDGFEALVRWQHPHSGMVLPTEFIPLAETTGLIVPLGSQVLRKACRDIVAHSPGTHAPMRIAINLSPRQFRAAGLVEMIAEALHTAGMPGEQLEIELTESVFLDDLSESAAILERFRAMGVRIVIDDFGVGYSSLGYLKRLPVDALKIDRVFVRDVTTDRAADAIAGTIIDLAHSLGMEVTAEGVETQAQLDWLRQRGCDRMQGFLFSGPQPVEVLDQLIETVRI